MKTRSLTISDYDEIIALWKRSDLPFRPSGRDRKEAVQAQMAANPDFFLGAFEGDRLVGTVVVTSDGRKGWINRLAVHPDFRRKGVAKTLIRESEETLRKHGLRIFCALIEDYNKSSMQLFRKCGYKEHRDIVYFSKRDSERI
jgi:ribosomal protein S18 acetylase RimI-like enzyme